VIFDGIMNRAPLPPLRLNPDLLDNSTGDSVFDGTLKQALEVI